MDRSKIEPQKHEPPVWRSVSAEAFGTFVLVFVDVGGAVIEKLGPSDMVTPVGRSLATGFTVMALIYALGGCSGAHVNPAVTAAFALRGVFPWRRIPAYWLAQIVGALAASLLISALFGNVAELGATMPHHGALVGFAMEIVLALLLVTIILSTATRHRVIGPNAAIAVGVTIALCALFSRPISGASMNPFRSLAPALVGGHLDYVWIYVTGPLIGAGLAVLLVLLLHGRPKSEEKEAAAGEDEVNADPQRYRHAPER